MSQSLRSSNFISFPSLRSHEWICKSCLHRRRQKRLFWGTSTIREASDIPHRSPSKRIQTRQSSSSVHKRKPILPDSPARTRFAPSPTGYLHIGGLRTALFSYLLAKRTGGQFLLRIEDTDQKRLVPDAEERLLHELSQAGLRWDEGPQVGGPYGPYKQSERTQIYQQHARELLNAGAAYRCFCTPQSAGQGSYVTSGCYQSCSALPSAQAQEKAEDGKQQFTVRLRQPEAIPGKKRVYPDLIYGKIIPLKRSVSSTDPDTGVDTIAGDTILLKSDGTPTYHFANVVDDHLMRITHVIRGTEWMASTPLHYDLYRTFGWEPPAFAHVGLLVDENKAKLSKRNADLALDVRSMRYEHGILPDALVNFLALQGWSNPTDNDVMTMDQLISTFDLKFTKGNTMVKMEKLWFLQKAHAARRCEEARTNHSLRPISQMVSQTKEEVQRMYPDFEVRFEDPEHLPEYCAQVLLADSKSYQNAKQFVPRNRYFFTYDPAEVPAEREVYDEQFNVTAEDVKVVVNKLVDDEGFKKAYPVPKAGATKHLASGGTESSRFEPQIDEISAKIHEVLERHLATAANDHGSEGSLESRKKALNKAVMRYLREKLSYGLPGPSIGVLMAILGYEECCKRLGLARSVE